MTTKPWIYLFGNSHVSMFTGTDDIVDLYNLTDTESPSYIYRLLRVGPSTAFNFFWNPKYYPFILNLLENDPNSKNAYIGLIVGEIDCRWHLGYNSDKFNISIKKCIDECVDRFFMCYIDLKKRGYKCIVFSVHPASTQPHRPIADGPFYGEYKNRNIITEYYNKVLEEKCNIHNIPYCNYFTDLMNVDYEPKLEYFRDTLHLKGIVLNIVESKLKSIIT